MEKKDKGADAVHKEIPEPLDCEYKEVGWAIPKYGEKFKPIWINKGKVGDMHVKFEMKYCGVCHSDVHLGHNDLGGSIFPMVPGHELIGTVVEVGPKVTKVKVGDNVGVGCMIDSCLECEACKDGDEIYCLKGGSTHTYNSMKKYGHIPGNPETQNFGGYSGSQVVHEHFILKIPDALPLEKVAPILCAGITLWDPLRHWGATKEGGKKMNIAIIGIGGLGTMGIKLAHKLGHNVYAISRSIGKKEMATQKGATAGFVISTDEASMKEHEGRFDLILNTVSAVHQVSTYLPLLKYRGTIVQLGLFNDPHHVNQMHLEAKCKKIAGSCIGGIPATEELLEFCAKHQILPDTQLIEANQLDWAWDQLNDVNVDGVRYIIDIKKSLASDYVPKE